MNKAELIEAVSTDSGLSKSDASNAVESIFKNMADQLQKGGSVSVVGFGQFTVSDRAARTGRNPRTGEEISIAASRAPKFKAGKQLKDAVNS